MTPSSGRGGSPMGRGMSPVKVVPITGEVENATHGPTVQGHGQGQGQGQGHGGGGRGVVGGFELEEEDWGDDGWDEDDDELDHQGADGSKTNTR